MAALIKTFWCYDVCYKCNLVFVDVGSRGTSAIVRLKSLSIGYRCTKLHVVMDRVASYKPLLGVYASLSSSGCDTEELCIHIVTRF